MDRWEDGFFEDEEGTWRFSALFLVCALLQHALTPTPLLCVCVVWCERLGVGVRVCECERLCIMCMCVYECVCVCVFVCLKGKHDIHDVIIK